MFQRVARLDVLSLHLMYYPGTCCYSGLEIGQAIASQGDRCGMQARHSVPDDMSRQEIVCPGLATHHGGETPVCPHTIPHCLDVYWVAL